MFDRVKEGEREIAQTKHVAELDPSDQNLCAMNKASARLLQVLSVKEGFGNIKLCVVQSCTGNTT